MLGAISRHTLTIIHSKRHRLRNSFPFDQSVLGLQMEDNQNPQIDL